MDPDGNELGEVAVKVDRLFGKGVHWSNEQRSLKYNGIGTVIGNLKIHAVDTHKYPLKSFFKMQFETINGCLNAK